MSSHLGERAGEAAQLRVPAQGAFVETTTTMPTAPVAPVRSTIGCVIPAYNEAETIAGVLDSMLAQTRRPDAIHVVVNNTTDETVDVASYYAGPHFRLVDGVVESTTIYVHDIGENKEKKVGALNYGFTLVEGMDYFLGVDGDTAADPRAIELLVAEIEGDPRIGGISAVYSIDDTAIEGTVPRFLIAGQRAQFASFNMQNLLKDRNMAVLGGQLSIFSVAALHAVADENHREFPWVVDSEVEDSLLSLDIKSAGYQTKISADARAYVGGMVTAKSLDAQQVKWTLGAIDLMWPGQRGNMVGRPFHPNLRLRWLDNISMLLNGVVRVGFVFLLTCALLFHAFVFSAWWLIPTGVAILLNFRVAKAMHNAHIGDYLFALLWVPSEIYMWMRLGHFVRSWVRFFTPKKTDNWALQAKAEKGGGGHGYLVPFAVVTVGLTAAVLFWNYALTKTLKSDSLYVGWRLLAVVTVLQTLWLLVRALRPFKGFRV